MHKTHLKWWLRDLNNIFQNSKLNILYNLSPLALLEIILDIQFLIVTDFQTFCSTFKDKVSTRSVRPGLNESRLRDLNKIFQNSKVNILYNLSSPLALLAIILDILFLIVTDFQTFCSTFKDKVSTRSVRPGLYESRVERSRDNVYLK